VGHQDEIQSLLKVLVTYPQGLQDCGPRLDLVDTLLRDANFGGALLVLESVTRDFPRDNRVLATALDMASLFRRTGDFQRSAELLRWSLSLV
jgi:hypothetical protein